MLLFLAWVKMSKLSGLTVITKVLNKARMGSHAGLPKIFLYNLDILCSDV